MSRALKTSMALQYLLFKDIAMRAIDGVTCPSLLQQTRMHFTTVTTEVVADNTITYTDMKINMTNYMESTTRKP